MKQLVKVIFTALEFSLKSRREGLLSLDADELDENLLGIFKTGMKLALDNMDPCFINKILSNMIEQEKDKKAARLKEIQKEAVLGIQAGDNTRILCLKMFSYLENSESRAIEPLVLNDDLAIDIDDIDINKYNAEPPKFFKAMGNSEFIKEAADVIKLVYNFSHKAIREGLLSLEDELEDIDYEILKEGLRLALDGTDNEIINCVLSNKIGREQDKNRIKIKKIMKEAVLAIQAGENNGLIIHKLISYISNSELNEISKILLCIDIFKEYDFKDINPPESKGKKAAENTANIICRAYEFFEKSKKEKISALLETVDKQKISGRDILEYGMKFAAEGKDEDDINFILSNLVEQERNEEIKRLKTVQKEAVLGICRNEPFATVFHVMLSYIDDKELEEVRKYLLETEYAAKFNELLENPFFGEDAVLIMEKQYASVLENSIGSKEVIDFFTRPYDLLKDTDREMLAEIIKNEHPQTLASVIAWLSCGCFYTGGIETAVKILKHVDKSVKNKIIRSWEDEDHELAEEVKRQMITFNDFLSLDIKDIQKVFRETDSYDLAKALKPLDDETRNRIFMAMSKRASSMLKEDMSYMGSVRLSDVKKSQENIASIVRKLDDYGEIVIH